MCCHVKNYSRPELVHQNSKDVNQSPDSKRSQVKISMNMAVARHDDFVCLHKDRGIRHEDVQISSPSRFLISMPQTEHGTKRQRRDHGVFEMIVEFVAEIIIVAEQHAEPSESGERKDSQRGVELVLGINGDVGCFGEADFEER